MKITPYICKTIETGNDLDTSLNFFYKVFYKKFGRIKTFY
jgi:hypothetical protein